MEAVQRKFTGLIPGLTHEEIKQFAIILAGVWEDEGGI